MSTFFVINRILSYSNLIKIICYNYDRHFIKKLYGRGFYSIWNICYFYILKVKLRTFWWLYNWKWKKEHTLSIFHGLKIQITCINRSYQLNWTASCKNYSLLIIDWQNRYIIQQFGNTCCQMPINKLSTGWLIVVHFYWRRQALILLIILDAYSYNLFLILEIRTLVYNQTSRLRFNSYVR